MSLLRREGELVDVAAEVDPHLEIAEIHRRVIAAGGPALLFEKPSGARLPVVTNLFGSARRTERAFGPWPRRFIERAARLPEELMPPSFSKLWQQRDLLAPALRLGMRGMKRTPVREVRHVDPRLSELPLLTSWPEDGGPFLTLPLVYTESPAGSGRGNLGIYRMQRFDDRRMGMHWQIGKGGGFHYAEAEAAGRPLPVSVFLGGPPALVLSAVAPLPEGVPELLLASLLLGERLPRSTSDIDPHPLLSECEIALVGEVPPHERRPEGPFGDHYGYYSLQHDYPVFHCRTMYRRKDAMMPATVVGKPRQEDFYIGDYLQELLSPIFPVVMPAVRDLWSYGETGYHSLAAAVVADRYPREAMASAFRILGEGQLSLTKFLILVDRPMELRNFRAVLSYALERCDFRSDLYVFGNLSMDTLDYNGPAVNSGSKGVLLGMGESKRELPVSFSGTVFGLRHVEIFSPGCLVIEGPSYSQEPGAGARIAQHEAFREWPLVILTDDARRCAKSPTNFLWTVFTRFEPAADIHAAKVELKRLHPSFTPPILIDARLKPGFPRELNCDEETAERVTRRWHEYFPEGGVEMGDSGRANLD